MIKDFKNKESLKQKFPKFDIAHLKKQQKLKKFLQ